MNHYRVSRDPIFWRDLGISLVVSAVLVGAAFATVRVLQGCWPLVNCP